MTWAKGGRVPRIRTDTRTEQPDYELRVVRSVEPGQGQLLSVLALLKETTSDFIRYKTPRKLGVTVLMLGPLMRHVFDIAPGRQVPKNILQNTEEDLRAGMQHAQYQDYRIPLIDPLDGDPIELYGSNHQYVGLRLPKRDLRLTGDRAMVEEYFKRTYGLSNNELDRHLVDLRPHITIGEVVTSNLSEQDKWDLRRAPYEFIVRASLLRQQRMVDLEDRLAVISPELPETVSLNGLHIVCQRKGV